MKPLLVCSLAFLLGVIIIGCVGCAGRSKRVKLQSPMDNPSLQFDLRPPIIDNGTKNP
jgi:hypothetical protein